MMRYLLVVIALILTLPARAQDLSPNELMKYQSEGFSVVDIRYNEKWI